MKKIVYMVLFLLLVYQVIAINSAPVADFNYEINGKFVIFDASPSYDPDGYIISYSWNFGDGIVGIGKIVNHTYELEGIYNVTLTVVDNSGNVNSTTKTITADITPPSTVCKLIPNANGRSGWYVSNLILNLAAEDALSGINKTFYKIDEGNWKEYISSVIISEEGVHTAYYYSVDKSGNYEESKSVVFKIDKTPPSTSIFIDKNSSNGWYNEKINVSLFPNDGISGINKTLYRINGGGFSEYNGSISIADGKYFFEYFSVDMAGNFEEINRIEIKIDTVSPEINILSPSKGLYVFGRKIFDTETVFVIGNITIAVECYDLNGIKIIEFYYDDIYRGNSNSSISFWEINEFSIGKHKIKLIAYDLAGNKCTKIEEVYIINLKWN
ncbi:MAG: PKD domain-containing protein [Thermoplasmatales archaeon]|nr:PKD domain-containing protein [Thermoplasmatales archaeon]